MEGRLARTYECLEIHRVEDSCTRYGKAGRLFAQHVRSLGRNLRARPELFGDADLVQAFIALPSTGCVDGSRAPLISTFYQRDKAPRFMKNDGLKRGLAEAGTRRVRELFSWDMVVDRTLEAFNRVVRDNPAEGGGP